MSKASRAAGAAAENARFHALIAEQDARHAVVEAADRREREQILNNFRNEIARDRLEAQAQALEAAAAQEPAPVRAAPPRDEATGRWLPQAEPEPQANPAAMSMSDYIEWRKTDGMDQRGLEHTGRTGKHLADTSGFPDWRSASSGNRVFESQIDRNHGKAVPPGYQRTAATEDAYR